MRHWERGLQDRPPPAQPDEPSPQRAQEQCKRQYEEQQAMPWDWRRSLYHIAAPSAGGAKTIRNGKAIAPSGQMPSQAVQ